MSRLSRNAPCPCGSGRKAKSCCGPVLDGAPARSAEALMRSRYTAYATAHVGHLLASVAPGSPHADQDPAALRAYCAAVRFEGLEVRAAAEDGDAGEVTFFARLQVGEIDRSFGERSRFVRRGGRWLYVDGDRLEP